MATGYFVDSCVRKLQNIWFLEKFCLAFESLEIHTIDMLLLLANQAALLATCPGRFLFCAICSWGRVVQYQALIVMETKIFIRPSSRRHGDPM